MLKRRSRPQIVSCLHAATFKTSGYEAPGLLCRLLKFILCFPLKGASSKILISNEKGASSNSMLITCQVTSFLKQCLQYVGFLLCTNKFS